MREAGDVPRWRELYHTALYGKALWEILNLSADPVREYDLCWTANTVGSGVGNLVTYVDFSA